MLKKIIFSLSLLALVANAEVSNQTIEDKFAACEKSFDMCIESCESETSNTKYDQCIQNCEEKLYKCNSEVEGLTDTPAEETKSLN